MSNAVGVNTGQTRSAVMFHIHTGDEQNDNVPKVESYVLFSFDGMSSKFSSSLSTTSNKCK
jgi:hypothetical protein